MAALKVLAGALTFVCLYATVSHATQVYYPSGGSGWGPWGTWCKCSKKCGGGDQFRTRVCLNPPYYQGNHPCTGKSKETRNCNVTPCAINGGWGSYGSYGPCSRSCGGGYQTRYRKCNNPKPRYGGKKCSGAHSHRRPCNVKVKCPIHGGWGSYGSYGPCSKTCGGGYQPQYRKCNKPKPQYGGRQCSGSKSRRRPCNVSVKCPINGGWSNYGSYGACSKSCGGGTQSRSRTCTNPKPQHGGKQCSGSNTQSRTCNTDKPCPIDGGWSDYSPYGACSKSCGGGTQSRSRTCTNPKPQHGGKDCSGSSTETRTCNTDKPCPINGAWTSWSTYGACSKTCGGGTQSRSRTCTNPRPQYGGDDCDGPSSQSRQCNVRRCPVRIGFDPVEYRVREGAGSVAVRIKRSADTSGTTTAEVVVVPGGSAVSADYKSFNGNVEFKPGDKSASVVIPIVDDRIVESAEFFTVELSSKDSAVVSVQPNRAKVVIIDNDVNIGFEKSSQDVPESIGSFKVVISRSGAVKLSHSVSVKSVDGSAQSPADFKFSPTTVTFGPNDPTKEVTVHIKDDKIYEKTENFKLVLSTSDNRVVITPARAVFNINIKDNDVKVIDGGWGPWSEWTKCNKPCGRGSQSRSRKCNNPAPQGGGRPCKGLAHQKRHCYNKKCCKVNGGWSKWSDWGPCSITCRATPYASGYQKRYRKCNNPVPSCGGAKCYGPSYMTKRGCAPKAECRPVY